VGENFGNCKLNLANSLEDNILANAFVMQPKFEQEHFGGKPMLIC